MKKGKNGKTLIDLTGERFGKLLVIEEVGKTKHGDRLWRCKCDCGTECFSSQSALRNSGKRSCGCMRGNRLTNEPKKFVKKTNGDCPYPTRNLACVKRQHLTGICCSNCERKEICPEKCLNSPEKCGVVRIGVNKL